MKFIEETSFTTKGQELFLRAAFLDGHIAIDAWKEWESKVGLDGHLDSGTFDLLPLLYMNLQRIGTEYSQMNKLKGIYRQAWYKNQTYLLDASRILLSLYNAGIKAMVLKGLALTIVYCKNHGIRPLTVIDILVPASKAVSAADELTKAGWSPATFLAEGHMKYRHSLQFINGSGGKLELHWNLIVKSSCLDSDTGFWDRAMPIKIHDVPAYAPDPTDMLFHVIVSRAEGNPEPPIHWIADAMEILKSSHSKVDWSRMIQYAKQYRVLLKTKEALRYLHETFQAKVPKAVLDSFSKISVSTLEQIEYRHIISNHETCRETLMGGFPLYLIEYLRLTRDTGLLSALGGFPGYLTYRLHEKNLPHLCCSLTLRIMRTTKRKISGLIAYAG